MKKIIRLYVLILVCVYALLTVLDLNGTYVLEKKVWSVEHQFSELEKDPQAVAQKNYDEFIDKCKEIIGDNKHRRDSNLIKRLEVLVGRVYELKEDYPKARAVYRDIINRYKSSSEFVANLYAYIGKTYELEENWQQAVNHYHIVMIDYALTEAGYRIPFYITNYYRKHKDYDNVKKVFFEAVNHYKKIIKNNPDTVHAYRAMRFLANTYFDHHYWKETVSTLGDLLKQYGRSSYLSPKDADAMVKTINIIAAFRLKDYSVATDLYKEIIEMAPNSPLSKYLLQMIDAFGKLKEENVGKEPGESSQRIWPVGAGDRPGGPLSTGQ